MAYLTIRVSGQEGYTSFAIPGFQCTIGRDPNCDLTLSAPGVSREHCRIEQHDAGQWTITDLASKHGTRVDRQPISGAQVLSERSIIVLGKARLTFHVGDMPSKRSSESAPPA